MTPVSTFVIQTGVTLLGVVALVWILLFAGRRFGVKSHSGPLRLRGRLLLDGRKAVYLVQVEGRCFVVGSSEAGLNTLGELTREEAAGLDGEQPGVAASFGAVLGSLAGRNTGSPPRESTVPGQPAAAEDEPAVASVAPTRGGTA